MFQFSASLLRLVLYERLLMFQTDDAKIFIKRYCSRQWIKKNVVEYFFYILFWYEIYLFLCYIQIFLLSEKLASRLKILQSAKINSQTLFSKYKVNKRKLMHIISKTVSIEQQLANILFILFFRTMFSKQ